MSEQTREEKVMSYSTEVLDNIKKDLLSKDTFFIEYERLLNNYTKLLKRYKKVVKLGDAFNNCLANDNKDISQKARIKIMNNASEQRKLKEKMAQSKLSDKKQIEHLNKSLSEAINELRILKEKTKVRFIKKNTQ
jgi:hypothetical protein